MQAAPTTAPSRRANRRWVTATLVVLIILLLLGTAALRRSAGSDAASAEDRAATSPSGTDDKNGSGDEDAEEDEAAAIDDAQLVPVDLLHGDTDPGDPGATEMGGGAGADPCAAHDPADGSLLVVPDPVVLPSGDLDGDLVVRNCSTQAVDWTAATKPSVALASAAGHLAPGQVRELGFVIDHDAWDPGAIDFKIKVSEPGHNTYVDVHAFRPAVGSDYVATNEISAGPGVGGCADQCIIKAALSTGYSSPDVGLDVATKVPAKVRVYLSKNPPVMQAGGIPSFPGKHPKATSPGYVQSWHATLDGLQPTTTYYIIVRAEDEDGDVERRHGSFRTVTPVAQPGGGYASADPEPGYAAGCMTRATLTPGDGADPAHLSVRTHTPATIQVQLSTEAPTFSDGVPSFAKKPVWLVSGIDYIEAWDTDISGLQPSTTYHGIVIATDANGRRHHTVGSFATDGVDILVTVHGLHLGGDGDKGGQNRGEIELAWGVGDDMAGWRSEQKLYSGSITGFGRSQSSYVLHDAQGELPIVKITAFERDPDLLAEWCTMTMDPKVTPGYSKACDRKWNVVLGPTVRAGDLARLPDCEPYDVDLGWADGCVRLDSSDEGDDHPRFSAVVSFRYVD